MSLEWHTSHRPVPYPEAIRTMEDRVAAIRQNQASELVWLLEHPSVYTAGTSAKNEDLLLKASPYTVYQTGRGGQYTYHGPGQRIAYVMLDLKRRSAGVPDIKRYVYHLEEWLIRSLSALGVHGERRRDRVGVWVDLATYNQGLRGQEAKIAALGVRIRGGVTYHGIALNINPNLDAYNGIVPCGIRDYGVTSLHALGKKVSIEDADRALRQCWSSIFP